MINDPSLILSQEVLQIPQAYTSIRCILIQVLPFPYAYTVEPRPVVGEWMDFNCQFKCLQMWFTQWMLEVPV